jgi:hypothetical protein
VTLCGWGSVPWRFEILKGGGFLGSSLEDECKGSFETSGNTNSVTSQKIWIANNTAMRTSNLAISSVAYIKFYSS